eukprot:TRINITY_DN299_c0_g3_i1.p2 TRINITY_DN299_c0_g3~~TRINITY_DN299_c0_g3_i1.p2  ORF type:complete len:277 (+),score=63.17 TRINITY_DN299_c0_g3_i1:46-831(+)
MAEAEALARLHKHLAECSQRYPHLQDVWAKLAAAGAAAKTQAPPTVMLSIDVFHYLLLHNPETEDQRALTEVVEKSVFAQMSGSPDEARFLAWLVETLQAKKIVEVGVFMGYTTLTLAKALPADGRVVALDVNEEWTTIGRRHWEQAGVAHKVDLRIGPAVEAMDALLHDAGEEGTFDLVFIDANKSQYDAYYERALRLLRVGGVVAVDNVLWHGKVVWPAEEHDEDTRAIVSLNDKIRADTRVSATMLGIADGLTLCRKL